MQNASTYRRCGFFLTVLALVWSAGLCAPYAAVQDRPPAAQPPGLAAAMAKYRQELAAYLQARDAYQAAAKTYWSSIAEKRRLRNGKRARGAALSIDDYVLDQPPVYSGPPKPRDPSKPPEPPQPPPYVPVVADFLAAAVNEFKFTPRMPHNDGEFKRAYAVTAAAAGLSKDQVVRIYSFEATGNGTYDLEAVTTKPRLHHEEHLISRTAWWGTGDQKGARPRPGIGSQYLAAASCYGAGNPSCSRPYARQQAIRIRLQALLTGRARRHSNDLSRYVEGGVVAFR